MHNEDVLIHPKMSSPNQLDGLAFTIKRVERNACGRKYGFQWDLSTLFNVLFKIVIFNGL